MTMARIYLATAALLTLAISGIAASAPRPALAQARPAAVQPVSSSAPADGADAAVDDGGATAWLLGGPRPANVCKPGTSCCFFVMPHVCGLCAVHC